MRRPAGGRGSPAETKPIPGPARGGFRIGHPAPTRRGGGGPRRRGDRCPSPRNRLAWTHPSVRGIRAVWVAGPRLRTPVSRPRTGVRNRTPATRKRSNRDFHESQPVPVERGRRMKVVLVASEAVPFAKTGGLADVAGALPRALSRLGVDASLVIPCYRQARDAGLPLADSGLVLKIPIGPNVVEGRVQVSKLPGSDVPVYLDRPPRLLRPPRPLPARRGRLRRQLRAVHLLPACCPRDDPRPGPPPRRDPRQRLADRPDPRLPRRVLPRTRPSSHIPARCTPSTTWPTRARSGTGTCR